MFQRENFFGVPPPPPVRKSRISSAPLLISSEFLLPLPPSPHTRYNVTVEDEKLENCLRYLLSDNHACVERFLRKEYKKPYDDSNNRAVKREANNILDKLHAITENITKHDDSLFMEGGGGANLRLTQIALTISTMRNDSISSLKLKKMCYILLRTCTD